MSGLAEALTLLAPEAERLERNRIREMGRIFAIEKRRYDEVVGVRLDVAGRREGAGRRCDGKVLGLVISARGLALRQQKRKQLRKRGVVLRIVSRAKGKPVKRSCQTLHSWLHGETKREASR